MFVATKGLLYLRTVGALLLRTAVFTYSKCDTVLFMVIATEVLLYLRTVGAIRWHLSSEIFVATEGLLYLRTVGAIRCCYGYCY
jgi:hypothetical protein